MKNSHEKQLLKNNNGLAVVEVILILVVVIALVIIFKDQLTTLVTNVFGEVNSKTVNVY